MNKKVLITGATSGLGLMLTKFFDENNFDLVVTGRNKKKLSILLGKSGIQRFANRSAFAGSCIRRLRKAPRHQCFHVELRDH